MKSPRDSIVDRGRAPNASEDAIQTLCFLLLGDMARERDDQRLRWIAAVPNGGQREAVSAGIMVATGTRSGIWDIMIPFPSGKYPFGFIEMKRPQVRKHKDGGLSPNQVEFGKHLVAVNAWYAICYSADEFIQAIETYLKGESYYGQ